MDVSKLTVEDLSNRSSSFSLCRLDPISRNDTQHFMQRFIIFQPRIQRFTLQRVAWQLEVGYGVT
jgi:hypothetical protein